MCGCHSLEVVFERPARKQVGLASKPGNSRPKDAVTECERVTLGSVLDSRRTRIPRPLTQERHDESEAEARSEGKRVRPSCSMKRESRRREKERDTRLGARPQVVSRGSHLCSERWHCVHVLRLQRVSAVRRGAPPGRPVHDRHQASRPGHTVDSGGLWLAFAALARALLNAAQSRAPSAESSDAAQGGQHAWAGWPSRAAN